MLQYAYNIDKRLKRNYEESGLVFELGPTSTFESHHCLFYITIIGSLIDKTENIICQINHNHNRVYTIVIINYYNYNIYRYTYDSFS